VTLGLKYKQIICFGGARHNLISCAHAEHTLKGTDADGMEGILDFPLFTFTFNGILLVSSIRSRAFDIPVGE
jgi:hypothetical protein